MEENFAELKKNLVEYAGSKSLFYIRDKNIIAKVEMLGKTYEISIPLSEVSLKEKKEERW